MKEITEKDVTVHEIRTLTPTNKKVTATALVYGKKYTYSLDIEADPWYDLRYKSEKEMLCIMFGDKLINLIYP